MQQMTGDTPVLGVDRRDAGIDILVELAERGEIDPWDVDIIEVTNRYLATLDMRGSMNLPVTGKMFFYAAVLLRMKAEALARQCDIGSALLPEGDEFGWEGDENIVDLPGRAQRRRVDILIYPSPRRSHRRPITLKDLIDALTLYERQTALSRQRALSLVPEDEVVHSAHQDHIGDDIERIKTILAQLIGDMSGDVRFDFRELLVEGLSPVTAFMALVFLATDSVVDLEQEAFYEDLAVRRLPQSEERSHLTDAESPDDIQSVVASI